MFGKRDASTYGTATLADINAALAELAADLGVEIECFQTNHEGKLCERIHTAHSDGTAAVLINAGAWTHYSYGMRDALAILGIPIIEVHMSNIQYRAARPPAPTRSTHGLRGQLSRLPCGSAKHSAVVSPLLGPDPRHTPRRRSAREDMSGSLGEKIRHHSVVSPLAKGIVAGFGVESYLLGLRAAVGIIYSEARAP